MTEQPCISIVVYGFTEESTQVPGILLIVLNKNTAESCGTAVKVRTVLLIGTLLELSSVLIKKSQMTRICLLRNVHTV